MICYFETISWLNLPEGRGVLASVFNESRLKCIG